MDPIRSSTAGTAPVAAPRAPVPQAEPLPSAPLEPGQGLADRPVSPRSPADEAPPLPVAVQRELLRPPEAPLMTQEQMVALLMAAAGHGVPRA